MVGEALAALNQRVVRAETLGEVEVLAALDLLVQEQLELLTIVITTLLAVVVVVDIMAAEVVEQIVFLVHLMAVAAVEVVPV